MTTTEHNVILPTFHLNGSSPEHLAAVYTDALNCVETALNAVIGAGPHGRDFYVNRGGPTLWDAQQQHQARVDAIDRVRRDLIILQAHALDHSL